MLNIAVEMLMETIMAEAEAEKLHEEVITNKAAVAARRKATAKKATKVAEEAAKFEKDAWKKPQKWEYEELKAPVQDDGNYSHHAYTLNRRTVGISFIELHHKRDFIGNEVEEYLTAEHRLDIIESKVLRKYEEYGTLVEEYKRYKSQEDWGTYDDWYELKEDMDGVVDKIYTIGRKCFDKLIPEYLGLCEWLGYIPNYDVVSAEQWRYF